MAGNGNAAVSGHLAHEVNHLQSHCPVLRRIVALRSSARHGRVHDAATQLTPAVGTAGPSLQERISGRLQSVYGESRSRSIFTWQSWGLMSLLCLRFHLSAVAIVLMAAATAKTSLHMRCSACELARDTCVMWLHMLKQASRYLEPPRQCSHLAVQDGRQVALPAAP